MSDNSPFRWGIIAPGRIAANFADALAVVDGATLAAVASRDPARGEAFVADHAPAGSTPTVYSGYEAMVNDAALDAVYIANPHRFHAESIRLCLEAGVPVLCEKPLTVTASEAEPLYLLAEERQVYLLEALWSRFLPVWQRVRQWLEDGRIGDVHTVNSSFCFRKPLDPTDRLWDLQQAGGAMLDLGVYPVSLSNDLFGRAPSAVSAHVAKSVTGVDSRDSVLLHYDQAVSVFTCGFLADRENDMQIEGTDGMIQVDAPFWGATRAVLQPFDEAPETVQVPHPGNGFEYEIQAVMADVRAERLQNARNSWDNTRATAAVMDEVLRQGNVRYPFVATD